MNRRVFSYRSTSGLGASVFLYLWGGLWTISAMVGLRIGDIFLNGHRFTLEQVQQFFGWAIAGGLLVVVLATRLLLGWLNERIVVTDRSVEWFDWLGRKRLRARLSTLDPAVDRQVGYGMTRSSVKTDGGILRFSSTVRGYFDLKVILADYARSAKKAGEKPGGSWVPTYHPAPKTFRYRLGRMHVYSLVLLAVMGWMMYQPLVSYAQFQQFPYDSPLPSIVFGTFCLLAATRLQIACWVERIQLGPEGIVWRDWKGRIAVSAALSEITGIEDGRHCGLTILRIDTVEGAIRASSFLVGFRGLGEEVRKVIDSRKPAPAPAGVEPAGR